MSYIPEDDEENDSGNHMMPTISEAILNVFMISLGNFGDIWDALAATNHQTIGEVKTLYNGTSINDLLRFLAILTYLPTLSFSITSNWISWTPLPTLILDVINGRPLPYP